jgi:PAS domain S-box-containing protein
MTVSIIRERIDVKNVSIEQMEANNRRDRERFLDVGSDLQVITRNDGYVQWISPTFEQVLGWTLAEVASRPWREFIHPEDTNSFLAQASYILSNNRVHKFENRCRHKDGSYRWMLWKVRPYLEEQVTYGTAIDITERKAAEAVLQDSQVQLQTLFDNAPLGIYLVDQDFRLQQINPIALPVFGNASNLIGQDFNEIIHRLWSPEYADEIVARFRHTLGTGEPYHEPEAIEKRLDLGVLEYYEWQLNRIPLPNGRYGVVCYFRDISAQVLSRQAIAASEERLRSFVEANVIGILFGDVYGGIFEANDELLRIIGYTREDLEARRIRWIDITPPEYLPLDAAHIAEAQERGACTPYEKEYIRKDGSRVPILLGYSLVGKAREESVVFVIDLSDRKQAEAQRDRSLAQEQQAREAAEQANRIKDEFLAVLSHELRSPLNPILGWTRMLQTGKLDAAKTKQALATIERNAKLQTELIADLLDVSRILQGKLSLTVRPVDLAATVAAAIETVTLAAEAKAIEIESNLEAGQVAGDSGRLQQIVWNLVSNAVKFTPENGRVNVSLTRMDNHAQIIVTDTGKGIAPEFLPHVFDYFRQEDSAITRKFGGLGLGLAIVRHLTELHGGTVRADSKGEGQGATFTVDLPLLKSSQESDRDDVRPIRSATLALSGLRAIVVDDEPDMREIVSFVLAESGAQVMTVATGSEVLHLLEEGQVSPDILLSDVGMPDMDGYMLLRQIRTLPPDRGGQVLAIALTAYAGEFNQQQALEAGFQEHIAKPVDPDQLIEAIVSLVRSR